MKVLYDTILKATYTGRPNRFVVTLDLNGESVIAHLPNPGRMWELLFTGVTMYIVPHDKPEDKIPCCRYRARWRSNHARHQL